MGLKHFFHSTKADPADPSIIGATKWNADHYYVDGAGAPIGNVGALLLAGAAGALTHLNSVAAGSVLTSAGAGSLPVWAAPTSAGPATNLQVASLGVGVAPTLGPGTIEASSYIVSGTNVYCGSTGGFVIGSRSGLTSPADGKLLLQNQAQNDFSLLQFGGTTAAFPALKRSGASLYARTADDSLYADVWAKALVATGQSVYMDPGATIRIVCQAGTPEGSLTAAVGSICLRSDGGASTTLYVKQSGGFSNTGWVAK